MSILDFRTSVEKKSTTRRKQWEEKMGEGEKTPNGGKTRGENKNRALKAKRKQGEAEDSDFVRGNVRRERMFSKKAPGLKTWANLGGGCGGKKP